MHTTPTQNNHADTLCNDRALNASANHTMQTEPSPLTIAFLRQMARSFKSIPALPTGLNSYCAN